MLGLAAARLSRRCTPAIVKWATCRGIGLRISRGEKRRNGYAQFCCPSAALLICSYENATRQSDKILSSLKPLVESTDKAETELPEAAPPE